jgi:hypothetical protein
MITVDDLKARRKEELALNRFPRELVGRIKTGNMILTVNQDWWSLDVVTRSPNIDDANGRWMKGFRIEGSRPQQEQIYIDSRAIVGIYDDEGPAEHIIEMMRVAHAELMETVRPAREKFHTVAALMGTEARRG